MSTATYPLGMKSQLPHGGYVTWKGAGEYQNPTARTDTTIRPLTNNDLGNIFPAPFGRPRPIKHYRRGSGMPPDITTNLDVPQTGNIDYNLHRAVRSATGANRINTTMDQPGGFVLSSNDNPEEGDCNTCVRKSFVGDWAPLRNATEVPNPEVDNQAFCCSQVRKALKRTRPASTIVKPDYFQTAGARLHRRCRTFEQRQFNFVSGPIDADVRAALLRHPFISSTIIEHAKPGTDIALTQDYVAQCTPSIDAGSGEREFVAVAVKYLETQQATNDSNLAGLRTSEDVRSLLTRMSELGLQSFVENFWQIARQSLGDMAHPNNGCARVYYKPSNPQFAVQGGVSGATRTLKLNVDTITTAAIPSSRTRGNNIVMKCA
jgi:hypothetical protein